MRRALLQLRDDYSAKYHAFARGLTAAGYRVDPDLANPTPDDLLILWNRNKHHEPVARLFESRGARVLVVENGYLGKQWLDGGWYAISLSHHNGAGTWPDGGPARWDALGVKLGPWQEGGKILILGQRGIGEPGIASPPAWAENTRKRIGGVIRPHPGRTGVGRPLERDLEGAGCVVTWASGAALIALMLGYPVFYEFPRWIGATASLPLSAWGQVPKRDDGARLAMFRRLAWAMWRLDEIRSGEAFAWLG